MRFGLLLLGLLTLPLSLLADDKMAMSMDKKMSTIIFDTITLGTDLYNRGEQESCLRLYQGSLMSLLPMMDHRPDLQKMAMEKFAKAKEMHSVADRAFAMREVLDMLRSTMKPQKSLWDRLGGEPAVKTVIHDFVLSAAPDPKVNFFRNGQFKLDTAGVEMLERRLVELVSAVTGGPLKYSGRDMKSAHAGMKITDAEFDALAGHLVVTLKKYKVPEAELNELIGIVASTRKDIVEMPKKPLWDRLGGEAGVRAVTREFLVTALKDPKANLDRNGNYPFTKERVERTEQLVVEFVSSVTGGPLKYSGRDMKNAHQGMKITEDEFNLSAKYLIEALQKYKVPQAEIDEFIGLASTLKSQMVEKK